MAVVAVDWLEFFKINEEQLQTALLAEHLLQIRLIPHTYPG